MVWGNANEIELSLRSRGISGVSHHSLSKRAAFAKLPFFSLSLCCSHIFIPLCPDYNLQLFFICIICSSYLLISFLFLEVLLFPFTCSLFCCLWFGSLGFCFSSCLSVFPPSYYLCILSWLRKKNPIHCSVCLCFSHLISFFLSSSVSKKSSFSSSFNVRCFLLLKHLLHAILHEYIKYIPCQIGI